MSLKTALGIYIHIPFCIKKCPYCDFYSIPCNQAEMKEYSASLNDEIKTLNRSRPFVDNSIKERPVDSIYFGGGTPSAFGASKIARTLETLREEFNILPTCEITVECNPSSVSEEFFHELAACGVNRISIGLQSAIDNERKSLGRSTSTLEAKAAVLSAKKAGIKNISLDLMLGVPFSTKENLRQSVDFCLELEIPHISAYMLKIEENTDFAKNIEKLQLPSDDEMSDMYLFLCDYLNKNGLKQYEISNFSKKGFESKHNLKYWNCDEYLGFGPSAHSFISGKRFYFNNNIQDFLKSKKAIFDFDGGSFFEYIMLRLRLSEGLKEDLVKERFSHSIPKEMRKTAFTFAENGLIDINENGFNLNSKGFLLSNTIINHLLETIDY